MENLVPIDTILCLSLESIRLLYKISKDNMEYLGEAHLSFTKYVTRIKDYLDKEGKKILSDPSNDFFKELFVTNANTLQIAKNNKERKIHYIVFHNCKLSHESQSIEYKEDWNIILCELLTKINLTSYYNMLDNETSSSPLKDLLGEIKNYPETFCLSESNSIQVEILIGFLMNHMKDTITEEMITHITDSYKREIKSIKLKKWKLKNTICSIIAIIKKHYNMASTGNLEYEEKIIPSLIAEALIYSKKFTFFIDQITVEKITKNGSPDRLKKMYLNISQLETNKKSSINSQKHQAKLKQA